MNLNATMFAQAIVFAILVWFTMKYVWPPLAKVLDDRALKIGEGLAAAEKAKIELTMASRRVEEELGRSRSESASRLADAERRAHQIIEEAKARATEEAVKIRVSAETEAEQFILRAREQLREQVAVLAVQGAEQILRREVNAGVHADLLARLKTEL